LVLAHVFLRGRLQVPWLERIDGLVVQAILPLLEGEVIDTSEGPSSKRPDEYRRKMAARHARLVSVLLSRKGQEEGVRLGRAVLYDAGYRMGVDLRRQLRISDSPEELMSAAKLLYRLLGINFQADLGGEEGTITVLRCSLSQGYGPITCDVISAMDEGVVTGLNPRASMRFEVRNHPGSPCCTARLRWEGGT